MKSAEPHALGGAADHGVEPLAHLARRLVGEGDREQFGRQGAAGGKDVGEPGRQHAGLAGPGAGEDQHRAVDRLDGPALRIIEPGQIRDVRGGRAGEHGGIGHAGDDITNHVLDAAPSPRLRSIRLDRGA